MESSWQSMFVTAALLVGCGSPRTADVGPTYCARSAGPVDSCEANATTGPVVQCGPERPVCTPPGQSGVGVWACCTSIVGGGVRQTICDFGDPGDASCPCVGCEDAGP